MVPTLALPPTTPATDQVTAVLLVPETAAVNAREPEALTEAVPAGVRVTATVPCTRTVAVALTVGSAVLVAVTGAIDRGACIRDFSQYPAEVGSENVAEHAYKF